ncbi:hypothetical protein TKK_0005998 [Trichogramma kaykai]|uniref:TFIIB-type domain-containing protein n=1 Tax=Trichogramma kaykai TaxID=54128 RepID=A0ABD2XFW4_9HYME
MSTLKCPTCGGTDIETGAHTVCTGCGVVLEDQVIVNEMTFDEGPSGHVMASGTFVSSDSTGVASSFNAGLMIGGKESKEVTLQNAKRGITRICQKLHLKPDIIEAAVNYYKLVLKKNLTRGRKQQINHAACIYIALRFDQSELLLIDLSDVVGVCVHELGRTYMKFAKELCQNPPSTGKFCLKLPPSLKNIYKLLL